MKNGASCKGVLGYLEGQMEGHFCLNNLYHDKNQHMVDSSISSLREEALGLCIVIEAFFVIL